MNRSSTCKEREGVGKRESTLQAEGVAAGKAGSWGRALSVWGKGLGHQGGKRGDRGWREKVWPEHLLLQAENLGLLQRVAGGGESRPHPGVLVIFCLPPSANPL